MDILNREHGDDKKFKVNILLQNKEIINYNFSIDDILNMEHRLSNNSIINIEIYENDKKINE